MAIKIDPEFQGLIRPLTPDEFAGLEASIAIEGCRDPLVIWQTPDGEITLLDGHNRLQICTAKRLPYKTQVLALETRDQAKIWIIDNQLARRNLNDWQRYKLEAQKATILRGIGRTKYEATVGRPRKSLSTSDNDKGEKHDTRAILASKLGWATGKVAMADIVDREANEEAKAKLEAGDTTIHAEHQKLRTKARAEEAKKRTVEQMAASPAGPAVVTRADAVTWLSDIEPHSVDLLLTDPPYATDVDDIDDFAHWLDRATVLLKPTGRAYVCIGAYPNEVLAYLRVVKQSRWLDKSQILVWTYRNTLGPSPAREYKTNWQALLYLFGRDAPPLDCPVMTEQFSVQDINAPDGRFGDRFYKWQKPDELAERLVRHSTKPGDLVIDPFAGSGSFLIAASRLGRIARGCDSDDEAIRIAADRGCIIAG